MRINYVAKRFVQGTPISGAQMGYTKDGNNYRLFHKYNRQEDGLIAEILDKKDNGDFTLILHPRTHGWGKTNHNNRVGAVLVAIAGDYRNIRYSSYVQWDIKVHDRKLGATYVLDRPIKFNYRSGKLFLDYTDLENHATPAEEQVTAPEPSDNSNIRNELDRLTMILTTV